MELSVYEHETEPFTASELAAVATYDAAVYGSALSDCFDCFDVASVRDHESEFGQDAARDMLRQYARMLNTWYLAIDSLLGDILTCTAEVTRYSTAATRYVKAAVDEYHHTRQDFEHTVTTWTLALLTGGADADYPPATRSLDLTMQTLSDL